MWIGGHPTPLQGKYQILYLDFSRVGGIGALDRNFDDYCSGALNNFALIYEPYCYPGFEKDMKEQSCSTNKLNFLDWQAHNTGAALYLIIDEYDNFTNVVLNEQGNEVYHALTHASGFNIGWNISTDFQFNMMLGFSEKDVREMLQYYKDVGQHNGDVEAMIAEMKPWYDNYCFAEASLDRDPKMFNCDMVFYYLRHYITLGKSPKEMIDPNTRTDYNKMKKFIQLDRLDGNRKGVLRKITEEGQIVTALTTTFPATEIANPEIFPSLLFYYGMLTITATRGQRMVLSIPNNNVRKQYYEFMLEEYQERRYIDLNSMLDLFYDMAYDGHWRESLEFIAHAYKENSSVRSAIEGERNIQGFFTAYLSVNAYYLLAPELELNHGFCDLFLMPDLLRYEVAHSCSQGEAVDTEYAVTLHCGAVSRLRTGTNGGGFFLNSFTLYFHPCRIQIGSHGRIAFSEFQFNSFNSGESAEQALYNTSANMFQQFRRYLHLSFHIFVYIGIADGMCHIVSLGGTCNIDFQFQVNDKFITYFPLLLTYTVVGKETDVIKEYITVHINGILG